MITHKKCPTCDRVAVVEKETRVVGLTFHRYTCGHTVTAVDLKSSDYDIESSDHKRLYKFQLEGAKFLEGCNGRGAILDEMGLGKTIQALAFLKKHPECAPFLVLCKSGLKIQWMKEIIRWCGMKWMPQIIDSSSDCLLPGFKSYITSLDLLRRLKSNGNGEHALSALGIRTVIIDEVQHIKNSQSKRTNQVRTLCRDLDYIIGLSGTPIKNNAGEYFPILNILYPEKFPRESAFLWEWVDVYHDGYKQRIGGLKYPDRFREFTKDFLIRRTRKEVLPDLPTVSRDFRFSDLGSEVEDAYKSTMKQFLAYMNSPTGDTKFVRESNIMAFLAKMRRLTGVAKINPCVEFVRDFLDETDRKIVVFVHHKDVGVAVASRLQEFTPTLSLTADLNPYQRAEVVKKFESDDHRVMVASTLASGEGLNLQICSDCVILERQWNPGNEEQAECRFIRIGQLADKVYATYPLAVGTVDEFFSEIVERKREIVGAALDGKATRWDESALIKELAQVLVEKGGKKWGW